MGSKKVSISDICHIGILTAIIAVMAQISIPMPYGVPMTLQTFAIPLAGIVLGAKKGAVSTLIYVLLGAVGVPVFSSFLGGLGIVLGYRGGFILSFPIMALAAGIGASKNNKAWLAVWLAAGAVINYICGMLVFGFVMSSDLYTSFTACVLPFIPTDIVKIALLALSGGKIKRLIRLPAA